MLAQDIMKTDVLSVSPQSKLRDALEIMAENNISGLPVLNENYDLVGIISESDIIAFRRKFCTSCFQVHPNLAEQFGQGSFFIHLQTLLPCPGEKLKSFANCPRVMEEINNKLPEVNVGPVPPYRK